MPAADTLIRSLEMFPPVLRAAVADLSADDARTPGADGQWSVVEIVAHLADEELEDFRARVFLTLADPSQPWPGINPEAAAADRRYRERDARGELERFELERARSVEMLRALDRPDWTSAHEHPSIGRLTAADLLTSWAAHDVLHLRQIAKRRFERISRAGTDARYAGTWS